ncbi:MAG: hypothetical protein QNJ36_05785 [Calothrix sp. MO_167.B42]|nr:hypothetical protein [Calothrix sp. MO_167.B42]
MAIDFRRTTINFDPTRGRTQSEVGAVVFSRRVMRADVALNGFDIKFTDDDHHVYREMIDARIDSIRDQTVFVRVNYLLRDKSGNIDDAYDGRVDVLVIAEVQ